MMVTALLFMAIFEINDRLQPHVFAWLGWPTPGTGLAHTGMDYVREWAIRVPVAVIFGFLLWGLDVAFRRRQESQ